jgi:hypothetical protein
MEVTGQPEQKASESPSQQKNPCRRVVVDTCNPGIGAQSEKHEAISEK